VARAVIFDIDEVVDSERHWAAETEGIPAEAGVGDEVAPADVVGANVDDRNEWPAEGDDLDERAGLHVVVPGPDRDGLRPRLWPHAVRGVER